MSPEAKTLWSGWLLSALLSLVLGLSVAAFTDLRQRQVKYEEITNMKIEAIQHELGTLHSFDVRSETDRAELRIDMQRIEVRQDRVIGALSKIRSDVVGPILGP